MEAGCVIDEVRSESLYKTYINVNLQKVKYEKKPRTQDSNAPHVNIYCTFPVLFTFDLFFFFNRLLPASTLSSSGNVTSRDTVVF